MTYVRVQVQPESRKESLIQTDEKTYTISVREPAQQGLANNRVKELLARELGVSLQDIRLISGHRSPRKIFTIQN